MENSKRENPKGTHRLMAYKKDLRELARIGQKTSLSCPCDL